MQESTTSNERTVAAAGSFGIHVLLAVLLMLMMRDCEGGGGDGLEYMALNVAALGDSDQGQGEPQPPASESSQPQPQPSSEETVETQQEAPITASKPSTTPKNPTTNPTPTPTPPTPQPTTSSTTNNALNALNKPGNGGSSGSTSGTGNEGRPDGSIGGKGIFSGGGGSGEWALAGRGMSKNPSLDEKPTESGTVVVDIIVDKNGNVVSASANAQKSRVSAGGAAKLFALAEKAAKSAKFSAKDGTGNQKGTITINFKLI